MFEVVLSPRALVYLQQLPWPTRALLAPEVERLGTAAGFLTLKPLLGHPGRLWGDIDPFVVECRVLSEQEAAINGIYAPALYVVEISRKDRLRSTGTRLIRQGGD